jgi:hypothetical protein
MEPESSPEISPERETRSRFPAAFVIGAVVVLLLFLGLMLVTDSTQQRQVTQQKLPFGAEEQSYAANIHFQDIDLSHSSNMLNQEFIYVTGKISNDGNRAVRGLELTLEFHDPFNQVILRETQRVADLAATPLAPGQQRDFQITIERKLPSEWNQQYPSIRATGLLLQ